MLIENSPVDIWRRIIDLASKGSKSEKSPSQALMAHQDFGFSWLARKTGISASTWNTAYHRGCIPRYEMAQAVSIACGYSVDYIYHGGDEHTEYVYQNFRSMSKEQKERVIEFIKGLTQYK